MIQVPVFNRFFFKILPFQVEISVLNIKYRLTDKFIRKDLIPIPDLDLDWRGSGEFTTEINFLAENWIRFIHLEVIPIIKDVTIAFNLEVGIRMGVIVT